ncbi:MAG: PEP-CTERM sorting domain-containing protein, partial [Pirellulaceae bacterium]
LGMIAGDGNPSNGKNLSGSTLYGVGPDQFALHPGPSGQPSILRWTAPAGVATSVHVEGQFFAGDIGVMKVAITLNNDWVTKLFQATDAGVFSFDQTVSPGDTIDFAVYDGFAYGSTPIDARISYSSPSAVPEPSSLGIASLLAIGAGVRRRRHRC